MEFTNINPGDLVTYEIKFKGKTYIKYGIYLYSYIRQPWLSKVPKVSVMVIGRLFPHMQRTWQQPVNKISVGNGMTYLNELKMKRIFLWKNDTIKVFSPDQFPIHPGFISGLSLNEVMFLSLASDVIRTGYKDLKYSHEK